MEAPQNIISVRTSFEGVDPKVLHAEQDICVRDVVYEGTIAEIKTIYWDNNHDQIYAIDIGDPELKELPFFGNARVVLLKVDTGDTKTCGTRYINVDIGDLNKPQFVGFSKLTENEVTWLKELKEQTPESWCTLY